MRARFGKIPIQPRNPTRLESAAMKSVRSVDLGSVYLWLHSARGQREQKALAAASET